MELTPEERRKIYEEEKARIEAREQLEREKRPPRSDTSVGMEPNVAGLLCYLGLWVTGIIFFVLERKNLWVRFHAAQSLLIFGTLLVAGLVLGWIPYIGPVFWTLIAILGFVLWIVLMVKAYNGERYKIVIAGDIAESMAASGYEPGSDTLPFSPPPPPEAPPAAAPATPPHPHLADLGERIGHRTEDFFKRRREGRIAASVFTIAFNIALLIFLNIFNEYVAYYYHETVNGANVLVRLPFFTTELSQWLPVLNTALIFAIAAHVTLIIIDKNLLRRILLFFVDMLGLATVISLVSIFPFDFTVIPNETAAFWTEIGVTIALIVVAVGIGVSLLVRIIKLLVQLGRERPFDNGG